MSPRPRLRRGVPALLLLPLAVSLGGPAPSPAAPPPIVVTPAAAARIRFAAREIRRYVYLRTGELLTITAADAAPAGGAIVLANAGDRLAVAESGFSAVPPPDPGAYVLRSTELAGSRQVWIVGADDLGTLYGAYRFAETLGVRFYLHGDVVPEERVPFLLPRIDEVGRPLFALRGVQPFHDFAEGPDWWNADDYRAVLGQLAKLRMNFLGLHTYPEGDVGPEPGVWIGLRGDYDAAGRVTRSYPASWHTTGRGGHDWWGYAPMPTSDFTGGAADLFDRDDFGADVMQGPPIQRQTEPDSNAVFNRTGDLWRKVFTEARRLGVKTCIGTETPLTIPKAVADRLRAAGRNPDDPAVREAVYAAMFERITRTARPDYYWLWTPENWTWEGNDPRQFAATAADIRAALGALEQLGRPFTLATCGWVLGPQNDRAALDGLLPPDSPMSCINQSVGHQPVERQFANIRGRPKWAIPWFENDGELIQPQLWAGRMRFDAADALRLGCTGLIGIHWRTKIIAPNVAALADAAWDQSWVPASFDPAPIPPQTTSGAVGGHPVAAPPLPDSGPDGFIYETVREGMSRYDLQVPSGTFAITMRFRDPSNAAPGQRVFTVTLDDRVVADHLDLAVVAGAGRTHNVAVRDHHVANGRMRIGFDAVAGQPCIAAIEIAGTTDVGQASYLRRINCGGPARDGYEADMLSGFPRPDESRAMAVEAFYRDFGVAQFGPEAGPRLGAIFARLDGKLPQTVEWLDGPGGITRHPEDWSALAPQYAFVDEFAALRPEVRGVANLERFDYWLHQFQFYRELAHIGCRAGAFDREMRAIAAETDPDRRQARVRDEALPARLQLAREWSALLGLAIAGTDTTADLGILANLEQHNRLHLRFLTKHDAELERLLGGPLPAEAKPSSAYAGPPRIIVPTVRTAAAAGEGVTVKVILVGGETPADPAIYWRPLGSGAFAKIPLHNVARRVYRGELPALGESTAAIEYYVQADFGSSSLLRWPASAPALNQTVVWSDD